jgi:hypothetical protein
MGRLGPKLRASEPHKLIKTNSLDHPSRSLGRNSRAERRLPDRLQRVNRIWPAPARRGARIGASGLLLSLCASWIGCGGATAPCPTPTTELDRSREETERLEEQIARESARQRALKAQLAELTAQVAATEAALDSLAGPTGP